MDETQIRTAGQQRCMVYPAQAFRVDIGANIGDPLDRSDLVNIGDLFTLTRSARLAELVLEGPEALHSVARDSSIGHHGAPARVLTRHHLMGARGALVDVLLLEVGDERMLMPLGPLASDDEYTLMAARDAADYAQVANVASVSFTRGSRITMGNGMQTPVEELLVGDKVLTRDNGPQPIRWVGRQTLRAEGNRAPVVITKGALNNASDLVISPDHRLFIYQRRDEIGAGRAEVLVRARHLVNNETIFQRPGGHVDYFHVLLDRHEILYVEGIQAESLRIAPEVVAGFDPDLAADLNRALEGLEQSPTRGVEPTARDLDGKDAAALLKRASRG